MNNLKISNNLTKQKRILKAKNPLYVRITKLKSKSKLKRQTALTLLNELYANFVKNSHQYTQALFNWTTINKNYKILDKKQKSLQSINAKRNLLDLPILDMQMIGFYQVIALKHKWLNLKKF